MYASQKSDDLLDFGAFSYEGGLFRSNLRVFDHRIHVRSQLRDFPSPLFDIQLTFRNFLSQTPRWKWW